MVLKSDNFQFLSLLGIEAEYYYLCELERENA